MRVGIIQPNFIPWRGYFDFIRSVDLFILLDDVQFTRSSWRTRNRIKTPQGVQWLSVPVHYQGLSMRICDTLIDESRGWRRKHAGSWQGNYADAPWFADIHELLAPITAGSDESLLALNRRCIEAICAYLDIRTPITLSSDYGVEGESTARVIALLERVGATHYLSGAAADDYLDKQMFAERSIALEYKEYDYAPYPQLWGEFEGAVTVLDLIANCGPEAKMHLASRTPDKLVQPAGVLQ